VSNVSESLLTPNQRLDIPDTSLLFYSARDNLKNLRSPFTELILLVISTE
jgi:hypothetical protein